LVGKQAASVPEQDLQYIIGLTSRAPAGGPFLKNGGQAETGRQQQEQNQVRAELFHSKNGS